MLPHIAKVQRYTLGSKIDGYFADVIESVVIAATLSKSEKLPYLKRAAAKLDLLKFFLSVAWEIRALDTKKYALLAEQLDTIGRQLGGWTKQFGS